MAANDVFQAVLDLRKDEIAQVVEAELKKGAPLEAILRDGLIAAMDEVGVQFGRGRMFLPEMMRAAQTMKAGMEVLKPLLSKTELKPFGTILIGTVADDVHDIGKNLVAMMLEGAGFKVIDIGVDVSPDRFMAAINEHQPQIVALSALLTTTMTSMQKTIAVFKGRGLAVKTIVGGAPVSQGFADQIGADGYAEDAPSAVPLVRSLLGI